MDIISDSLPLDKAAVFSAKAKATLPATNKKQTHEPYPVMGNPFLLAHTDIGVTPT